MTKQPANQKLARSLTTLSLGLIVGGPILIFVVMSFLQQRAMLGGIPGFKDFTLRHYEALVGRIDLLSVMSTSFWIAIASTVFAVCLGIASAYFVSRGRGMLPSQLYVIALTVWFVPPVALSLQIFYLFRHVGLHDSAVGMIMLYATIHASLVLILIAPYVDSISQRVDEAAWIDGLRGYKVLYVAHLKPMTPIIVFMTLFTFMLCWNELLLATILTDRAVKTLPVALLGLTTGSHVAWGQIAALGTLSVVPALVTITGIWYVASRYLQSEEG